MRKLRSEGYITEFTELASGGAKACTEVWLTNLITAGFLGFDPEMPPL